MRSTSTSPVSSSTATSATRQAWAKAVLGFISPVSASTAESGIRKMPRPAMVLPCLNCAACAVALTVMLREGAPRTWMLPRPSVTRSAALTSSSSAAASSSTPRASRAATMMALPMRCVPREAKEPMSCGPVSLSAVST